MRTQTPPHRTRTLPQDDVSPQDRERAARQREKQQTLADVLEKAGEAYRKHLKNSPRAVDYLKQRGLSGAIAKRFGLTVSRLKALNGLRGSTIRPGQKLKVG